MNRPNVNPAFRGPDIPGYVKVSNHPNAGSEEEAIAMGANFLEMPTDRFIAVQFQPEGRSFMLWASYIEDRYAAAVAMQEEHLAMLLDLLTKQMFLDE
jgi:hypothetical protein